MDGYFIWKDGSWYKGGFIDNHIKKKDIIDGPMTENTMGIGLMIKCTEKVYLHGQMEENMKAIIMMT